MLLIRGQLTLPEMETRAVRGLYTCKVDVPKVLTAVSNKHMEKEMKATCN